MARITVLNLGRKGVSIAKNPLAIEDGSFLNAQNAELDFNANDGAITKRKGLREVNGTALDGAVLALYSGGLFFPAEIDPDDGTPQTLGGGEPELGPAALNVMRAKGYLSAATTAITNILETTVSFDAEAFDVGNLHDLVVDPSRFTVPAGGDGLYLVVGQAQFAGDADGIRSVRLYVNTALVAQNDAAAGTTDAISFQVATLAQLVAADYVEMKVYHSAGAALDLNGSTEHETFLTLTRILSATTTVLPHCQGLMLSNLSCAAGAATLVPLDGETFDSHTMHDNAVNNSRIVVPASHPGRYSIVGHYAWGATMSGAFLVELLKNGTSVVGEVRGQGDNLVTSDRTGQVAALENLSVADYIELRVTQNTAGAHNLLGGAVLNRTKLTMVRVG